MLPSHFPSYHNSSNSFLSLLCTDASCSSKNLLMTCKKKKTCLTPQSLYSSDGVTNSQSVLSSDPFSSKVYSLIHPWKQLTFIFMELSTPVWSEHSPSLSWTPAKFIIWIIHLTMNHVLFCDISFVIVWCCYLSIFISPFACLYFSIPLKCQLHCIF